MGGEGNLLASAVVTTYATFLCFSAVSKTPTADCNPFVGESNFGVLLIGLGLTVLSLFWYVAIVLCLRLNLPMWYVFVYIPALVFCFCACLRVCGSGK